MTLKSFSAGALPRTPLGELTRLPKTPFWAPFLASSTPSASWSRRPLAYLVPPDLRVLTESLPHIMVNFEAVVEVG